MELRMSMNSIKGLEKINKNVRLSWEDHRKFVNLFETKIRGTGRTTAEMIGEASRMGITLDYNYLKRLIENRNFIIPNYSVMDQLCRVAKKPINIQELRDIFNKYEKPNVKRGDVWYIDLGHNAGSEQSGVRPCVVLQNNKGNNYSSTFSIVPVTDITHKTFKRRLLPTQTIIKRGYTNGLKKDSIVMCEQLKTLDEIKFLSYVGELSSEELREVDRCTKIQLDNYTILDKIMYEIEKKPEGIISKLIHKAIDIYNKSTDDLSA